MMHSTLWSVICISIMGLTLPMMSPPQQQTVIISIPSTDFNFQSKPEEPVNVNFRGKTNTDDHEKWILHPEHSRYGVYWCRLSNVAQGKYLRFGESNEAFKPNLNAQRPGPNTLLKATITSIDDGAIKGIRFESDKFGPNRFIAATEKLEIKHEHDHDSADSPDEEASILTMDFTIKDASTLQPMDFSVFDAMFNKLAELPPLGYPMKDRLDEAVLRAKLKNIDVTDKWPRYPHGNSLHVLRTRSPHQNWQRFAQNDAVTDFSFQSNRENKNWHYFTSQHYEWWMFPWRGACDVSDDDLINAQEYSLEEGDIFDLLLTSNFIERFIHGAQCLIDCQIMGGINAVSGADASPGRLANIICSFRDFVDVATFINDEESLDKLIPVRDQLVKLFGNVDEGACVPFDFYKFEPLDTNTTFIEVD